MINMENIPKRHRTYKQVDLGNYQVINPISLFICIVYYGPKLQVALSQTVYRVAQKECNNFDS